MTRIERQCDTRPMTNRDEYPPHIVAMLPSGTVLPPLPTCHYCGTRATT